MDIGTNIRVARKNARLTQEQLAKKCNLATITIRQYELGKREPKMEQLSALASALGIHILELLGYPARQEHTEKIKLQFSIEHMSNMISNKYGISKDLSKRIVEDCYHAIKMDGQEIIDSSTMADLYDGLVPEKKNEVFIHLKNLMDENCPEVSSDGH